MLQYAEKVYGPEQTNGAAADEGSGTEEEADIEAEINKEIADIRKPANKPLFTSVRLDTQCCKEDMPIIVAICLRCIVVFFKTQLPIEPVTFVEKLCQDTLAGVPIQNCRYVKRLTPITAIEKANVKGLEIVAKLVLAPHFHEQGQASKKVSYLSIFIIIRVDDLYTPDVYVHKLTRRISLQFGLPFETIKS
jgi:tRNA acetyltransferase TAN1